jgi:hypothetical protein
LAQIPPSWSGKKTIAGRARAVISEEMVQAKGSTGFADPVLVSFLFCRGQSGDLCGRLLLNLARAHPKIDAFGISASFLFCLSLKISVLAANRIWRMALTSWPTITLTTTTI